MTSPVTISYLLAGSAALFALRFHLVPSVFAGLTVYVLTLKLSRHLPKNMNSVARQVALGVVVISVMICMTGIGAAVWSFIGSSQGIGALLSTVVETLGTLRRTLPSSVADVLPTTIEGLRQQLAEILTEHVQKISVVGFDSLKLFAHVLLGMVVGGMAAVHHFSEHHELPSLTAALRSRLRALVIAFDKVVLAQVKISALNTTFTALYLLVVLPLFDVYLPMSTILVLLTFAVGMLPVVGNLVSNTFIVVISLGVSPMVGGASLIFLVLIHKAEYFMNARIVGNEVQATAWELLSAMLLLESMFGIAGLVAAPVVYAWLKAEVKEKGII